MSSKHQRPRCFLDISINGVPQGRIVCELFDDVVPKTCANFIQLCEGSDRLGKETGKRLSYRGCSFHRIIKDFMIQGGDFSENNGTGGESVYGGVFSDENFSIRHNKPFMLSMANRGENTNGSQFFITTAQSCSELDGKHVAFGTVVHGKSVVQAIENVKVNHNNAPVADVIISDCGRLVPKKPKEKEDEDRAQSPVEFKSSKKTKEVEEEKVVSSIRPEDLPEEPRTRNFLLRRVPEDDKGNYPYHSSSRHDDKRRRSRSPRRYDDYRDRRSSNRRESSHSRIRVKGRGTPRYRSRSRSRSPLHWRVEEQRMIPMKKAKELIARKRKEAEKSSVKDRKRSSSSSSKERSPVRESVRLPREATPDSDYEKN